MDEMRSDDHIREIGLCQDQPQVPTSSATNRHVYSGQGRQYEHPGGEPVNTPTEPDDQYTFPEAEANLDEVAAPSPIYDSGQSYLRRHEYLEDVRSESSRRKSLSQPGRWPSHESGSAPVRGPSIELVMSGGREREESLEKWHPSKIWTKLYTISYLIFFSFLGTLLRLAIESLTFYPGAPVITSVLWANVGGSFIMGFLSEDRELFRSDSGQGSTTISKTDDDALWKAHEAAHKKTVPLYIGLSTGFCGSLTSFSTFIRDVFFAISNNIPTPLGPYSEVSLFQTLPADVTRAPNGGYSFMSVMSVLITEIGLSLAALFVGAHFALLTAVWIPTISRRMMRRFLDPLAVIIAPFSWAVVICLVILLPHHPANKRLWSSETWRGPSLFSLAFAPVGCLVRFYVSLKLNSRIPVFPLGTFVVNVGGTMILGLAYSLQHAPISSTLGAGGYTGCQVLQGIMDGFCGCVTTVSTWVLELSDSRRRHAYFYGGASVATAVAMLVVEIGSLRWTRGLVTPACFA